VTRNSFIPMMIRFMVLFHLLILSASAWPVGTLFQHLYYPSVNTLGPHISLPYASDCHECLCFAKTLPYNSIVAINCLPGPQLCLLYRNYSENYLFRWNSTGQIYFFQLPPYPPITAANTAITSQTTMRSTSKWKTE
jgi:hypothetical protein